MVGISTCWWDDRTIHGEEIINDLREFEVNGVELEYRITHSVFRQMRPFLNKAINVLSIHNYFPKPNIFSQKKASGDYFLLSSTEKDERTLAIKYTIKTLEQASDLETLPVILHLGRVEMPNPTNAFADLFKRGKIGQEEGNAFLNEQRKIRGNRVQNHLDAVLFSLDRLNHEAEKIGVFLCLENRYHFHEIPDFQEIGIILNEFTGGRIKYWHDFGHATAQEAMGICKQRELLNAYSDALMGFHIHDVQGLEDHLPLGKGTLDYKEFWPFLKLSVPMVLEIHNQANKNELEESIQRINREIRDMEKEDDPNDARNMA